MLRPENGLHHLPDVGAFVFVYEVTHSRIKSHDDIGVHSRENVCSQSNTSSWNMEIDVAASEENGSAIEAAGIVAGSLVRPDEAPAHE